MGLVQDEPAISPILLLGQVSDDAILHGKIIARRRAEKRTDFGIDHRRPRRVTVAPRRDARGDPSAPRQFGLIRFSGPGIGQSVPRHLLHQNEGIVQDVESLRRHLMNGL